MWDQEKSRQRAEKIINDIKTKHLEHWKQKDVYACCVFRGVASKIIPPVMHDVDILIVRSTTKKPKTHPKNVDFSVLAPSYLEDLRRRILSERWHGTIWGYTPWSEFNDYANSIILYDKMEFFQKWLKKVKSENENPRMMENVKTRYGEMIRQTIDNAAYFLKKGDDLNCHIWLSSSLFYVNEQKIVEWNSRNPDRIINFYYFPVKNIINFVAISSHNEILFRFRELFDYEMMYNYYTGKQFHSDLSSIWKFGKRSSAKPPRTYDLPYLIIEKKEVPIVGKRLLIKFYIERVKRSTHWVLALPWEHLSFLNRSEMLRYCFCGTLMRRFYRVAAKFLIRNFNVSVPWDVYLQQDYPRAFPLEFLDRLGDLGERIKRITGYQFVRKQNIQRVLEFVQKYYHLG